METLRLRFSARLLEALRARALKTGIPLAAIVRNACAIYLAIANGDVVAHTKDGVRLVPDAYLERKSR